LNQCRLLKFSTLNDLWTVLKVFSDRVAKILTPPGAGVIRQALPDSLGQIDSCGIQRHTIDNVASNGSVVAEIISFDDKFALRSTRQAENERTKRFEAFRETLRCSCCISKCEKCGISLPIMPGASEYSGRKLRVPYRFCESCSREYIDYIERLKGKRDSNLSWQNAEWMESWQRWIDYQWSVDRYLKSKEYRKLAEEVGRKE